VEVTLSYPLPPLQSVVQGTSIQFQADLPAGASRVQWSVNGVVSKTGTYTPSAAPRRHTLKVTAFDAAGLQLSSATGKLDVTVKVVEPPPPVEPPPTPEPEPPPVVTIPPSEPSVDLASLPLVQKAGMAYAGAFRYPWTPQTPSNWGYATVFAYNQANQSLVGVSHDWHRLMGEFSIPELRTASTSAGLLRGTMIQPFADATGGRRPLVCPNGNNEKIGGLLPWGDKLIISAYEFYDANGSAVASHIVGPSVFANAATEATGPYRLDAGGLGPGFVAGYMAVVPEAWRTALGGPAVTGQGGLSTLARTSFGPSLFAFNPDDLGAVDSPKATPLLYYTQANPLGPYQGDSQLFNGTTKYVGMAFPKGSRSVLFFGWHGAGPYCYGEGTKLQPAPAGTCYDPEWSAKGEHGYPYVRRVWAYDLLDLVKVKAGTLKPWEPRPYAFWDLDFPIKVNVNYVNGAAYDPVGNRLFVGQPHGDGDAPAIHVYGFTG
jgi:hypothetical protein